MSNGAEFPTESVTKLIKGHADFSTNCSELFEFKWEERIEVDGIVQYKEVRETIFGIPVTEEDISNKDALAKYESEAANATADKSTPPEVVRGRIAFATALSRFAPGESIEHYLNPLTKQRSTAQRRLKFAKFPKYLLVQSRRFTVGENWQPKKLNVELELPDSLDLEGLRGGGAQPGENVHSSTDETQQQPQIDESKVNELVDMGYPYHAARKAVYHAKGDPQNALEWLMLHIEDTDFNEPLVLNAVPSASSFDPEMIAMITSMGFTETQSKKALNATDGNVERAIDWIFSHLSELDEPSVTSPSVSDAAAAPDATSSDSSNYKLRAFISHMGTSTACGHYVAHVKDGDERWLLFNDNKVAFSKKPPKDLGYLYLYEQI